MRKISRTMNRSVIIGSWVLCWCCAWISINSWASNINLLEQALDDISAKGDITVGGNLSNSCTTGGANTICVGTYAWTDDHTSDASVNKGGMVLNGNTQQYLVSNINVNTTVSPTATGVNTIGTVSPASGATLNMSNNNNATGFIGGF